MYGSTAQQLERLMGARKAESELRLKGKGLTRKRSWREGGGGARSSER
jgi:hypothetical protein